MNLLQNLPSTIRGSLIELVRPGEGDLSGKELWRLGSVALAVVIVVTNLIGACAVLALGEFVLPNPPYATHPDQVRLVNALVAAGYVALAVPAGVVLGTRGLWRLRAWLRTP